MQKDAPDRDLRRLRWIGILAPVAFVWIFELVRSLILDHIADQDLAHVVSALIMAGGVVAFAILMSAFLDRTQRRLVQQNRDMMAMTSVRQGVRANLDCFFLPRNHESDPLTFEEHASYCGICIDTALLTKHRLAEGASLLEIRLEVDRTIGSNGVDGTHTPMPPAV